MKFIFDRDAMIKEVAIAQEIISTKNAGSILSNILISAYDNTLTLKANDIKTTFETHFPAEVIEEGSTTVYCDKFMGILNSLPEGEIEFNQIASENEDYAITVIIKPTTKKIKFQMKSISMEKFPDFETADNVPYFEIPSKDLKDMIKQTIFAVSDDEARYFLQGIYFEKNGENLNLVATDGRRLSFASKNILNGIIDFPSAIVHPKILTAILKHAPEEGNLMVAIVDKMIFFKFGNYSFGSPLIEGQFPNYQRVIPQQQSYNFQVQKDDLSSALKRVALMVDKKAGRIYFNISSGVLKITSSQSDMGSADEEIPCQYDGEDFVIAVNYKYVDEPLRSITADRITFEFTEDMKAVTMRPEPASDYFHIIMPMQKE